MKKKKSLIFKFGSETEDKDSEFLFLNSKISKSFLVRKFPQFLHLKVSLVRKHSFFESFSLAFSFLKKAGFPPITLAIR